jgi:hypothetical protein
MGAPGILPDLGHPGENVSSIKKPKENIRNKSKKRTARRGTGK